MQFSNSKEFFVPTGISALQREIVVTGIDPHLYFQNARAILDVELRKSRRLLNFHDTSDNFNLNITEINRSMT